MPFTKIGKDKYISPAGNTFTRSQVSLWHRGGGKFPGQKGMGETLPGRSPATPGGSYGEAKISRRRHKS